MIFCLQFLLLRFCYSFDRFLQVSRYIQYLLVLIIILSIKSLTWKPKSIFWHSKLFQPWKVTQNIVESENIELNINVYDLEILFATWTSHRLFNKSGFEIATKKAGCKLTTIISGHKVSKDCNKVEKKIVQEVYRLLVSLKNGYC